MVLRNGDSTALFTAECQSFLDNLVANLEGRAILWLFSGLPDHLWIRPNWSGTPNQHRVAEHVLIQKVSALACSIRFEGPNAMRQKMDCTQRLTIRLSFAKRGLPSGSNFRISNDRTLKMLKSPLRSRSNQLLSVSKEKR